MQLAQPGEAILVHEGVYPERVRIEQRDGTAAAPITLRAAPGARAVIRGGTGGTQALVDVRRAHWHVEGLVLDVAGDRAFAAIWRSPGARHGVLRGCEAMNGTAGAGVTVAEGASDVRIEDNHLHHFRKAGDDSHGVLVQTTSARVVVRNNDIHHNSGDAVQCIGPEGAATIPGTPFDDLLVENNRLHQNDENGIDVKTCTNVTLRGNDIWGHVASGRSRGEAIVIHLSAARVRVEENRLWDNGRGISLGGVREGAPPSELVVRRNQIWSGVNANGEDGAGLRVDTVEHVQVFHNTFHGMPGFCLSVGSGDSGPSSDVEIRNNVFSDCATAVKRGTQLAGVRLESNLYHRGGGAVRFQSGGASLELSAWRSSTGWDAESLEGDPQFVAPEAADFRLGAQSAARERGTPLEEGFCGERPDLGALELCV